jgi:hypothetical protein
VEAIPGNDLPAERRGHRLRRWPGRETAQLDSKTLPQRIARVQNGTPEPAHYAVAEPASHIVLPALRWSWNHGALLPSPGCLVRVFEKRSPECQAMEKLWK